MAKFKVILTNGTEINVEGDFLSYRYDAGFVVVHNKTKSTGTRGMHKGVWPFRQYVQESYQYDDPETVGLFPKDQVAYVIKGEE